MRKPFTTTIDIDLIKKLKLKSLEYDKNVNDILEELIFIYLQPNVISERQLENSRKFIDRGNHRE